METDAAKLPSDVETLKSLVVQSHATIAQHVATIGELTTKLSKLEHYLEQLVRARYGPRSEKGDPHQLVLFDAAATDKEPAAQPAQPAVRVKEHPRRGGGRQELPEHLERRVVEHDLPDEAKCCPGCGTQRERIGCEESEQLEYEPAVLYVQVHRRWKYACRRCGEHVATAPPAAKPIDKGLPGPGLLAALVTGKYSDHRNRLTNHNLTAVLPSGFRSTNLGGEPCRRSQIRRGELSVVGRSEEHGIRSGRPTGAE